MSSIFQFFVCAAIFWKVTSPSWSLKYSVDDYYTWSVIEYAKIHTQISFFQLSFLVMLLSYTVNLFCLIHVSLKQYHSSPYWPVQWHVVYWRACPNSCEIEKSEIMAFFDIGARMSVFLDPVVL